MEKFDSLENILPYCGIENSSWRAVESCNRYFTMKLQNFSLIANCFGWACLALWRSPLDETKPLTPAALCRLTCQGSFSYLDASVCRTCFNVSVDVMSSLSWLRNPKNRIKPSFGVFWIQVSISKVVGSWSNRRHKGGCFARGICLYLLTSCLTKSIKTRYHPIKAQIRET